MRGDRIEVVINHSKLERERWVFWFRPDHSVNLILDEYHKESRETSRKRNWTKEKVYLRVGDMRCFSRQGLDAEEVPVPEGIVAEVKRQLHEMIDGLEVSRGIR